MNDAMFVIGSYRMPPILINLSDYWREKNIGRFYHRLQNYFLKCSPCFEQVFVGAADISGTM